MIKNTTFEKFNEKPNESLKEKSNKSEIKNFQNDKNNGNNYSF